MGLRRVTFGVLADWDVAVASPVIAAVQFDGADMSEVVMSKAYAAGASFKGVDFSNAVLDRVNFEKANLQGALFTNTVLSGSTFDDAQLQDAVFNDTIIGYIDLQKLCTNTTISEDGRATLGCRCDLWLGPTTKLVSTTIDFPKWWPFASRTCGYAQQESRPLFVGSHLPQIFKSINDVHKPEFGSSSGRYWI